MEGLREVCDREGIVLIFDEVITGFRVGWGGAQALYGVKPDLTCLGKIIGGGLPVGAYGGRRDLMTQMAPSGPIYQAGTLSGNPVAVAAGLATLKGLSEPGTYEDLEEKGAWLAGELATAAARQGVALTVNRVGSMLTLFFTGGPVRNLKEAQEIRPDAVPEIFRGDAGSGDLPAALAIRGLVRLPGPHPGRPGVYRGGGRGGLGRVAVRLFRLVPKLLFRRVQGSKFKVQS